MEIIVFNEGLEVFNRNELRESRAVELVSGGILTHGLIKRVLLDRIEILIYNEIEDRIMTLTVKAEQMKTSSRKGATIKLLT